MKKILVLGVVIAMFWPAVTFSGDQIYKWVDEAGIIHFSDIPVSGYKMEVWKNTTPPALSNPEPLPASAPPVAPDPSVLSRSEADAPRISKKPTMVNLQPEASDLAEAPSPSIPQAQASPTQVPQTQIIILQAPSLPTGQYYELPGSYRTNHPRPSDPSTQKFVPRVPGYPAFPNNNLTFSLHYNQPAPGIFTPPPVDHHPKRSHHPEEKRFPHERRP
ncbi:MAG: hypothetical protein HQK55_02265 [Deltaproteobacteria bacterium]|nr:hypothetical protein [Deltaproteobacteria bacterium]